MRIQVRIVAAGGRHLRAEGHTGRLVADVEFAVAGADGSDGCIPIFIDIHAIIAVAQQREGELGSVDFEAFFRRQRMQPDVQGSGGDFDLRHRVIEVQEREIGAGAHADGRIVGLQLDQAVRFGPDMVAIGDGVIQLGWNPIVDAGGLKRNGSGEIAQTRHPAGRGCVVVLREGR